MILVNNPGDWGHVYWPLAHAAWHGWTPTDLIFPFFLFMVGMALPYSRRVHAGEALRRAAVIAGLGLFMAAYPYFDLATVRIPGVLMRIAVCYLVVFGIRRVAGPAGQAVSAAILLLGYWVLMTRVTVPDGTPPNLGPETNLGAWLDRTLLDGHLWKQSRTWDPEGVLSTLPAIATTLLGLLAGEWLRTERTGARKTAGLLAGGLVLVAAGLLWGRSFPINKSLWTSSYAILTAGMAAYLFGLVYWIADVRAHRAWCAPLVAWGRNAILVFVASGLLAKTLGTVEVREGVSVQAWLFGASLASWLPPYPASLAWAVANVLLWHLALHALDRRRIYLKV
jgi:predicted acyltransferase